ncbi:hypothetical protein PHMEG_00011743 [Phytophthora megakarya]|uniref:Uncharacterized protein n=1 Tax=Phytophthora megakarya TaxID=4795 RepID=A0A225WAU0_9STRA|nr:hypothetical protein PHMEG_00011743 [Phytophthora megakarya]
MDVMPEYWGDLAGMGNVSLLSTDEPDATASQGLTQENDGSGSAGEEHKASQGEAIERGIVAVGVGLRAIGERMTSSTTEQDKTDEMLNAIREQTNSIQALVQFLKNKDN